MNKKRSRLEVIYDILKNVGSRGNGIKPTHILYKSNLSHKMMQGYLVELLDKGFIVEKKVDDGKVYVLSDKGKKYLSEYRVMTHFLDSFGLE